MKPIAAYILFLYILFLATAQGVLAMYAGLSKQEQKVDCCNKCSTHEKAGSSEKNTPSDNCNPLGACNSCFGYTVNVSLVGLSILPVFFADKHLIIVQDKFSSKFSFDFWQPPRLG